ncbi:MAG: RidA family protein [Trinickia sp.]|uniref:RidA family protein n=1 Tax=Trinickia sp. TaxID=2571163 RepID=UPI003F8161A3
MNTITRIETGPRLSKAVIHNGIAYISGLTAANRDGDATVQTEDILAQLDTWLKKAGTDRSRLLCAQIWVADMARDFNLMNVAWEAWMPEGTAPARATTEAMLASPAIRVEIMVTAAVA